MPFKTIKVENPKRLYMVIGETRFEKAIEEIHQALVNAIPGIRFGLAFNDSQAVQSMKCSGTDDILIELASRNAANIGVHEMFVLFVEDTLPMPVMETLKRVSEIREIYCATNNPVEVIVAETETGRGVMGLVDDYSAAKDKTAIETTA